LGAVHELDDEDFDILIIDDVWRQNFVCNDRDGIFNQAIYRIFIQLAYVFDVFCIEGAFLWSCGVALAEKTLNDRICVLEILEPLALNPSEPPKIFVETLT
jgi:hypothetical protein